MDTQAFRLLGHQRVEWIASYRERMAELACSGLGAQAMGWQTSPAATEVEEVVMDWLRQMLGLAARFTGVIEDSASTSTLCALLCARERTGGFGQNRGGLRAEAADSVVMNPHKWLGTGFDLSAYFVRDPQHLIRVSIGSQASGRSDVEQFWAALGRAAQ
jgi:glutamate/tyrosine decarboxylase-like PLP-dependent enzyme